MCSKEGDSTTIVLIVQEWATLILKVLLLKSELLLLKNGKDNKVEIRV
jgi:hypothetical protein